jgi:putative ABC transport system permease protein
MSAPRTALLFHEIRTALGSLRRRSLYTVLAVGMLALSIGANFAVFNVIFRTLLRPLPYASADRLVAVSSTHKDTYGEVQEFQVGSVEYVHWKTQSELLSQIEVARTLPSAINDRGKTETIKIVKVSGGIFRLLGVRMAAGRDYTAADDVPNARVVVLDDAFWRRRFGADPGVIGRTVAIEGTPLTVIGVTPRGFHVPQNRGDAYVPLGLSLAHMPNRPSRFYASYARLRDGATADQANADLGRISKRLEQMFPEHQKDYGARVKPLREALYGDKKPALLLLLAAVLLVHVLACVNVANLMLAQIADQEGVTALRIALGARRLQVVRLRLIESVAISGAGALLGSVAGWATLRVILSSQSDPELIAHVEGAGWMTALCLAAFAMLTGLAVAIVPALRERPSLNALINEGSLRTSSSVRGTRARNLFVTAQVALAVPLLVAAAATVKHFRELQRVDVGFVPDKVITGQLFLPERYPSHKERSPFVAELVRRLETTPGVASAAVTTCTFKTNESPSTVIRTERMQDFAIVGFRRITPRYFETMGIPLVAGRAFTAADTVGSPPVAIVSSELARQYWPGENPIGRKVRRSSANSWVTVVGVAPDVRDAGVEAEIVPTIYVPFLQNTGFFVSVVVRAQGDPSALGPALDRALWSVDRGLALADVVTLSTTVADTLAPRRLQVSLLSGFALIAIALAAVGIYAITAYTVTQRMRETGVRLAFGAAPRTVVLELVRRATFAVAGGLLAGAIVTAAIAIASERLTVDVGYAAAVLAILFAAALAASFIPAMRARGATPASLLREA